MGCESIRMSLYRMAEGEASPEEALAVGRHLPGCTACRIQLARERRLAAHLENDLEDLPVGEDFVRSVMERVRESPPPRRRPRRLRLAALAGAGLGGAWLLARATLPAGELDIRAAVGPVDGPQAVDAVLPFGLDLLDAMRVALDTAATLIPIADGNSVLAPLAATLAAGGVLAMAVGSTVVALAAGSVLRLVR